MIIKTQTKREVVDITDLINQEIKGLNIQKGICHLFLLHTTAALTTADLDPGGTDIDYLEAFEKIIPKINFRHPHDPVHMPSHFLSSLIGTSLVLPIENGRLLLGTWQRVVLIEFEGPRSREIILRCFELK